METEIKGNERDVLQDNGSQGGGSRQVQHP